MNRNTIIDLKGKTSGPTSIILAGVHGDETCGVKAFEQILPELKITAGRVLFAFGNPRAIQQGVRLTEANLNRMFKSDQGLSETERNSYEYARAQELKTWLDKADVLLDIHASFTPESRPFIICEPNAGDISSKLPIDLIVNGFDAIEPGGTDYYMNSTGKIGLCAECGYLGHPRSDRIAERCLLSFLQAQGHIAGTPPRTKQERIVMHTLYHTKTERFIPTKAFKDFAKIITGELLGHDGDTPVICQEDGIILFARATEKVGEEAFLLGTESV